MPMPARSPRRPGATWSRTPGSASPRPISASASPGRRTATTTGCRRGGTIRSAIRPGEAIFLRDDETRQVWSATPLPAGGGQPYTVRHGQGYSIYEHTRDGIARRCACSCRATSASRSSSSTLRNASTRTRRLSVTLYVEWTLGEQRSRTRLHVVTSREPATGAVLAINAFREPFGDRVAFVDLHDGSAARAWCRRRGASPATAPSSSAGTASLQSPAALARQRLSDRIGAGARSLRRRATRRHARDRAKSER